MDAGPAATIRWHFTTAAAAAHDDAAAHNDTRANANGRWNDAAATNDDVSTHESLAWTVPIPHVNGRKRRVLAWATHDATAAITSTTTSPAPATDDATDDGDPIAYVC